MSLLRQQWFPVIASLFLVANVQAAATSEEVVIPQKSTQQFLDKVPNSAGRTNASGEPPPTVLGTGGLGVPSTAGSSGSVNSMGSTPHTSLSQKGLQGGKIEYRTIEKKSPEKRTIAKPEIKPQTTQSPW